MISLFVRPLRSPILFEDRIRPLRAKFLSALFFKRYYSA